MRHQENFLLGIILNYFLLASTRNETLVNSSFILQPSNNKMSTTTATARVAARVANSTARAIRPSIFLRPTEAPFVVFVLLAVTLFLGTTIAVLYMMHQHSEHMKKMNAVRGFHQQDIDSARHNTTLESPPAGGGAPSTSRRASLSSGAPKVPGPASSVSGADSSAASGAKPSRRIFDFHHTPKQPSLDLAGAAKVPQLNLAAVGASSSGSGSFTAPSPNRAVGMSSFRRAANVGS